MAAKTSGDDIILISDEDVDIDSELRVRSITAEENKQDQQHTNDTEDKTNTVISSPRSLIVEQKNDQYSQPHSLTKPPFVSLYSF